jgi:hypothetical protein
LPPPPPTVFCSGSLNMFQPPTMMWPYTPPRHLLLRRPPYVEIIIALPALEALGRAEQGCCGQ